MGEFKLVVMLKPDLEFRKKIKLNGKFCGILDCQASDARAKSGFYSSENSRTSCTLSILIENLID